jgi:hypothetical protein
VGSDFTDTRILFDYRVTVEDEPGAEGIGVGCKNENP